LKDQPVFTYKQDYSQLFLASGHYRLAGLLTGHMDRRETTVDVSDRDRMGAWLLQKKSGRTV
jgi:hypothetical protein